MVEFKPVPLLMDNIVFSLQKAGGASVYWSKLERSFDHDEEIDLKIIEREDAASNVTRAAMGSLRSDIVRLTRVPLRMDQVRRVKIATPQVFHSSCYRIGKGRGVVNVTTVHDFICMRYYTGFLKWFSFWQIRRAVKGSDGIICISESTKKDLLHYVPESSELPIEVIHHSYDEESYSFTEKPRKAQVAFIGARGVSYKNFRTAVDSVALNGRVSLRIIGAPLNSDEEAFLESSIPGKYTVVEYPTACEISSIFQESVALLYLSEYEGFGIPVLEGMASGVPVIASNRSSIPEVGGDASILLDEITAERVSEALDLLLDNEEFFLERRMMGLEQAKRFSWGESIQKTKDFYRRLWDARGREELLDA